MIEKETNEYIGNVEIMKIIENVGEIGIAITSLNELIAKSYDFAPFNKTPNCIFALNIVGSI
jgi:hypothetical protein